MSLGLPPPQIDDLVVDLRTDDEAVTTQRAPHHWRTVTLAVGAFVLALIVIGAYETLATTFMHDQRQRHLAADFAERKPLAVGHAAAILQIASIGVDEMVVESDRVEGLRGGPIHDPRTPLPGARGNALIIGRRTRFGGPFAHLERLKVGDQIVVRAKNAPVTSFTVVCTQTVSGGESPFAAPSDGRRLTLVTAAGGLIPTRRVVVVASADPSDKVCQPTGAESDTSSRGSLEPRRGSPLANLGMLVAYLAIVALVATWRWTRRVYRLPTAVVVSLPLAALAVTLLLFGLDRFLPGPL